MLNTTEPFLTGECEAARELQQFSLGQIHQSIRRSLSREYSVFISLTRAFRDKDDKCTTIERGRQSDELILRVLNRATAQN